MRISRTPLRVSLFGGGTDYPEFFNEHEATIISTTIDKYIYVIVKNRHDDQVRASYTRTETVPETKYLEHELIREALLMGGIRHGVEVATMADIPSRGSGLASSSAVTVGTLAAVKNIDKPSRLAPLAYQIEHDILDRNVGFQDHYGVAYGGLKMLHFSDRGMEYSPLKKGRHRQLEENLLLFNTGQQRQSETILKRQRQNITTQIEELKQLTDIVGWALIAIATGDYDQVGPLLHESWLLKRTLADGIENETIETMYNLACEAGATGGKICGAGGGGYLLVYCPEGTHRAVRDSLSSYDELDFHFEWEGVTCKQLY